MTLLDEMLERLKGMPAEEVQAAVSQARAIHGGKCWVPTPGPQTSAYLSDADEIFYGGEAGGGKTDLIIGAALTGHKRSLVLRRETTQARKLVDRFAEILGSRDGWNGQENTWRTRDGRVIDIGGCQYEDDKQDRKGIAHDLKAYDEVSDFTESQYVFINTWNRSVDPKQRCRIIAAGNPPTTAEGLWVVKRWAPWLDPTHPNPAASGELRWFTANEDGKDTEVDGPGPHLIGGESVMARSRTFIRARLTDNPYLRDTNYAANLAALPPELRAAYRDGRFDLSFRDGEFQVIPTAWIMAAQARWTPRPPDGMAMTAMAYDPAGGGADKAELAARHGWWYAPLVTTQGPDTADGSASAALIIKHRRDNCPVVIDVGGGFGGAVKLRLADNGIPVFGFNGSAAPMGKSVDGTLNFANKRALAWWRMRESLDPDQPGGSVVALPPDPELRADLAAPTWRPSLRGIVVESKAEVSKDGEIISGLRKRLGRSPGKGDAVVMALSEGERAAMRTAANRTGRAPVVVMGHEAARRRHRAA